MRNKWGHDPLPEPVSSFFETDKTVVNALLSAVSKAVNDAGNFKWLGFQDYDSGRACFELKTRRYTYKLSRRDIDDETSTYDLTIHTSEKLGEIPLYKELDSPRIQQWFLKLEAIKGIIPFTPNVREIDYEYERRESDRDAELRAASDNKNFEDEVM